MDSGQGFHRVIKVVRDDASTPATGAFGPESDLLLLFRRQPSIILSLHSASSEGI